MAWNTTADQGEFRSAAGAFLSGDPVRHTLLLTVGLGPAPSPAGDPRGPSPDYGWWTDTDGEVTGAFVRTPGRPLLLSPMFPHAAERLGELLAGQSPPPVGVDGPLAVARTAALAWSRCAGRLPSLWARNRLYELGELRAPAREIPGSARTATRKDRDLLLTWFEAFFVEAQGDTSDMSAAVDRRLSDGGAITLWQLGQRAVSMAGTTPTMSGMVRIAPVYTPHEHRRNGFGEAATVAACRQAARAGATDVVLFADLANPASNALYRKLGFLHVEDYAVFDFQ